MCLFPPSSSAGHRKSFDRLGLRQHQTGWRRPTFRECARGAFRDDSIGAGLSDLIALVLFLFGSWLNSFSEMQRKWWKADPANTGHCYTEGLFAYSMHINYFGDTVLFAGWCLFTGNMWLLGIPLLMGLSFVFFHIPGLDSYLADRYGEEFRVYSQKTRKFIPFVY